MRLTVISDTHNFHDQIIIKPTDVLIHCGDATDRGSVVDTLHFMHWFRGQPARHKIYIPGNHDLTTRQETTQWQQNFAQYGMHCLVDQALTIEGRHFYGTPWSVQFGRWAWMAEEEKLAQYYQGIPEQTEFLISHGPAYGHGDKTSSGDHAGSLSLLNRCMVLPKLKQMFSGHIHEAAGESFLQLHDNRIQFSNCSIVNLQHKPVHQPRVFDV